MIMSYIYVHFISIIVISSINLFTVKLLNRTTNIIYHILNSIVNVDLMPYENDCAILK
jgi:hypothetical protein